ncbi:Dabb family protein [uncultured Anaerotruncus sp.]|uniref:Dabb family protein n=1 Tax=uncultured Anaerotruncus sp. TaxID=905011 RepID=UPI00280BA60B|nr:Dabb family protein [uncultured Anaerotruncus sp.]
MVKHIVMWKLEEVAEGNTREDNARLIKQGLEALNGVIDGILTLEVGKNINPKGFDLVLYSEFVSAEALKAYDQHPEHLKMREFIRKVITERVVADYEA